MNGRTGAATSGAVEPGVLVLGEVMRVLVAEPGDALARADRFRSTIGGAEANVAVALSRMGFPAAFVGALGADDAGDYVLRRLRAEGVGVGAVVRDDSAPTGMLLRNTSGFAPISVAYHRAGSAGSKVSAAAVRAAFAAAPPGLVHVTGITPMLSAAALTATEALLDLARDAGSIVSFDVNLRTRIAPVEHWQQTIPAIARRAEIVFVGDSELAVVDPALADQPVALAESLLDGGARIVVLKNPDHTCTAVTADEQVTQESLVRTVIDPVGAGDALVAGFLAGQLRADDLAASLLRGAAVAAHAVEGWSDTESLPTAAELDAFLRGLGATGEQVLR